MGERNIIYFRYMSEPVYLGRYFRVNVIILGRSGVFNECRSPLNIINDHFWVINIISLRCAY